MRNIDINIDFNVIETDNHKTLRVADNSNWSVIESEPSIIEITLPGMRTAVVNYFDKKSINNFNSVNLNLSCVGGGCDELEWTELPDGVYTICVKGSPSKFQETKNYFRTNKIRERFDLLIINSNIGCEGSSKVDFKDILDIDMLIKSTEAHTRFGDINSASRDYQLAVKMLDKQSKCKDCI